MSDLPGFDLERCGWFYFGKVALPTSGLELIRLEKRAIGKGGKWFTRSWFRRNPSAYTVVFRFYFRAPFQDAVWNLGVVEPHEYEGLAEEALRVLKKTRASFDRSRACQRLPPTKWMKAEIHDETGQVS